MLDKEYLKLLERLVIALEAINTELHAMNVEGVAVITYEGTDSQTN